MPTSSIREIHIEFDQRVPMRDGIEWCASQSWLDGNVGTTVSSYPGCIQWYAPFNNRRILRQSWFVLLLLIPLLKRQPAYLHQ